MNATVSATDGSREQDGTVPSQKQQQQPPVKDLASSSSVASTASIASMSNNTVSPYSSLASRCIQQGHYHQAMDYYQKALHEYQLKAAHTTSLNPLGSSSNASLDLSQSSITVDAVTTDAVCLPRPNRSLSVAPDRRLTASFIEWCNAAATLFNLGALAKKIQNYRQAVDFIQQSQALYRHCLDVLEHTPGTVDRQRRSRYRRRVSRPDPSPSDGRYSEDMPHDERRHSYSDTPADADADADRTQGNDSSSALAASVCLAQLLVETLQTRAHIHAKYCHQYQDAIECHRQVVDLLQRFEQARQQHAAVSEDDSSADEKHPNNHNHSNSDSDSDSDSTHKVNPCNIHRVVYNNIAFCPIRDSQRLDLIANSYQQLGRLHVEFHNFSEGMLAYQRARKSVQQLLDLLRPSPSTDTDIDSADNADVQQNAALLAKCEKNMASISNRMSQLVLAQEQAEQRTKTTTVSPLSSHPETAVLDLDSARRRLAQHRKTRSTRNDSTTTAVTNVADRQQQQQQRQQQQQQQQQSDSLHDTSSDTLDTSVSSHATHIILHSDRAQQQICDPDITVKPLPRSPIRSALVTTSCRAKRSLPGPSVKRKTVTFAPIERSVRSISPNPPADDCDTDGRSGNSEHHFVPPSPASKGPQHGIDSQRDTFHEQTDLKEDAVSLLQRRAKALVQTGEYDAALQCWEQLVLMQCDRHGQESVPVAQALQSMGYVLICQDNIEGGIDLYQAAMDIYTVKIDCVTDTGHDGDRHAEGSDTPASTARRRIRSPTTPQELRQLSQMAVLSREMGRAYLQLEQCAIANEFLAKSLECFSCISDASRQLRMHIRSQKTACGAVSSDADAESVSSAQSFGSMEQDELQVYELLQRVEFVSARMLQDELPQQSSLPFEYSESASNSHDDDDEEEEEVVFISADLAQMQDRPTPRSVPTSTTKLADDVSPAQATSLAESGTEDGQHGPSVSHLAYNFGRVLSTIEEKKEEFDHEGAILSATLSNDGCLRCGTSDIGDDMLRRSLFWDLIGRDVEADDNALDVTPEDLVQMDLPLPPSRSFSTEDDEGSNLGVEKMEDHAQGSDQSSKPPTVSAGLAPVGLSSTTSAHEDLQIPTAYQAQKGVSLPAKGDGSGGVADRLYSRKAIHHQPLSMDSSDCSQPRDPKSTSSRVPSSSQDFDGHDPFGGDEQVMEQNRSRESIRDTESASASIWDASLTGVDLVSDDGVMPRVSRLLDRDAKDIDPNEDDHDEFIFHAAEGSDLMAVSFDAFDVSQEAPFSQTPHGVDGSGAFQSPSFSGHDGSWGRACVSHSPTIHDSVSPTWSSPSPGDSSRAGLLNPSMRKDKPVPKGAKMLKLPTLSNNRGQAAAKTDHEADDSISDGVNVDASMTSTKSRFVKALSSPFRRSKTSKRSTSGAATAATSPSPEPVARHRMFASGKSGDQQRRPGVSTAEEVLREADEEKAGTPLGPPRSDAPAGVIVVEHRSSDDDDNVSEITFIMDAPDAKRSSQEGQWWWGVSSEGVEGWFPSITQAVQVAGGLLNAKTIHDFVKARPLDFDSDLESESESEELDGPKGGAERSQRSLTGNGDIAERANTNCSQPNDNIHKTNGAASPKLQQSDCDAVAVPATKAEMGKIPPQRQARDQQRDAEHGSQSDLSKSTLRNGLEVAAMEANNEGVECTELPPSAKDLTIDTSSPAERQTIAGAASVAAVAPTPRDNVRHKTTESEIGELEDILREQELQHGSESIPVAATLFTLAALYTRIHRSDDTIQAVSRALKIYRSKAGYAEAARSLHRLADVHCMHSQYKSALSCFSEARRLLEAAFGEFHEEIAKTLNCIGNVLARQGEFDLAMENHKEALHILKECVGEDLKHPLVSQTLIQIGAVYYKERNSLSTIQYNQDDYSTFIEGGMLEVIGRAHEDRGSYRMAIAFFEEKLQFLDEGTDPEQQAETYNSLGMLSSRAGLYIDALDYYQKATAIQTRMGQDAVQQAISQVLVASVYYHLGDFKRSLRLTEESLSVLVDKLGREHETVAAAMFQCGTVHARLCQYDCAMELFQDTLDIQHRLCGDLHPATLRTTREIGNLYAIYEAELSTAMEDFEDVLTSQREIHGERHPNIAETLHSMGVAQSRKRDGVTKALKTLEDCYNMRLEFLGMDHPAQATTLIEIAKLQLRRNRVKKALHIADAALNIRKESLSDSHLDVAIAMSCKASCLVARGENTEASKLLNVALPAAEKAVGPNHPDVADMHVQMGRMHLRSCRFEEATASIEKALECYRNARVDDDHPGIREAKQELENVERAEMLCV